MTTQIQAAKTESKIPYTKIVVREDPEDLEFEKYLDLWIDNKVSYEILMAKYPAYNSSMLRKLFITIFKKIQPHLT